MILRRILLLAVVGLLLAPASGLAAGPHLPLVSADILGTVDDVFSGIGHAVLGAFSWTVSLATNVILTTIAALVRMLIPRSWVHQGLQIMEWIVAVPNYAGTISTPGGGHVYGFSGINALRDVFMWLGIAIAPLTLVYATSRAMIGEGDPVAIPVLRIVAVGVVIIAYPYWWSQAAALADQVTNAILTIPQVTSGLYKLMQYAVAGVALGGWQLIDLGLMGAIGLELLGLIFVKVVLILLGAILYATGPLAIGLVPTRAGSALARAWVSAVMTLLGIGIAWATVFAVGALLIGDASSAGPLIAGNSSFGTLAGGLLLAVAGVASLWVCLKATREAGGLLRIQLAGLLTLAGNHRGASSGSPATRAGQARTTGSSLRDYGSRLSRAASAAGGELAIAGAGGSALATGARSAAYVGRRGLLGTAAAGARHGAQRVATPTGELLGRSRAGAVAARMARAGTASWTASRPSARRTPSPPHSPTDAQPRPGRRPPRSADPTGRAGSRTDRPPSPQSTNGASSQTQSATRTRPRPQPAPTRSTPPTPSTGPGAAPPPARLSPPAGGPVPSARSPEPPSRATAQRRAPTRGQPHRSDRDQPRPRTTGNEGKGER